MLKHRVIPLLLLKNNGLYKTVKFKKPRYVGDPLNAIRIFNDKEVDELAFLDIDASRLNREPNYELIEKIAGECFMPLCYGGGVTNIGQASRIFSLGVEKICIQTAAMDNLSLISELSDKFGSQSIVVSVDVKKNWLGKKQLYSSAKQKVLHKDINLYVQNAIKAGAGEIIINSVDSDGCMKGMDLNLISDICNSVAVPVIAAGGAGNLHDIKDAIQAGASAVAAGSFFVFHGPHKAVLITYPQYHELEALLNNGT